MATVPVAPVPQEDDDPAGMSQYPAWMQEAASPYVDPINALRAAAMRQSQAYPDTPGSTTVHTPTDDLTLGMISSSPEQQRDLQSQEATQKELDDLTINQPDDRQYNEILNEAKAKNDADARYGGPEATRQLQRAVDLITAKGTAEQNLADSPTARDLLTFKTDEGIRAAAPRFQNTLDVATLKAQVEQRKNEIQAAYDRGEIDEKTYATQMSGYSHLESTPVGQPFAGAAPTAPGNPFVTGGGAPNPLAGLHAAASQATGGGGRVFNTVQNGLIAKAMAAQPGLSRDQAIAYLDANAAKIPGWS